MNDELNSHSKIKYGSHQVLVKVVHNSLKIYLGGLQSLLKICREKGYKGPKQQKSLRLGMGE